MTPGRSVRLWMAVAAAIALTPAGLWASEAFVYVDDDWAGYTLGQSVGITGFTFGTNAFDRISSGIAVLSDGGTIFARAGVYNESVVVPAGKPMFLVGAQVGVAPPCDGYRGTAADETILDGVTYAPGSVGVRLTPPGHPNSFANRVEINGLVIRNYETGVLGRDPVIGNFVVRGMRVRHTIFENCGDPALPGGGASDGLWHSDGGAVILHGADECIVQSNTIRNCERGVMIGASNVAVNASMEGNNISSNCIRDGQQYAIAGFADQGNGITFSNNTISQNTIYNNGDRGIQIVGGTGSGNTISNNTITNNAGDGIAVEGQTGGWILGNTVTNCAFTTQTLGGSTGDPNSGYATRPVFGGVTLGLGGGAGLAVTGATVQDNDVHDNGRIGAAFDSWTTATTLATANGLFIDSNSGAGVVVFHNKLHSNEDNGIRNDNGGVTILAEENWWGSSSWAGYETTPGIPTEISGLVDWEPWAAPNFAGALYKPTTTHADKADAGKVDGDTGHSGGVFGYNEFRRIYDAVRNLETGGTTHVAAGIYYESVVFNVAGDYALLGARANVTPPCDGYRGVGIASESVIDGGSYSAGTVGVTLPDPPGAIEINGLVIRNFETGVLGGGGPGGAYALDGAKIQYTIFENCGDPLIPGGGANDGLWHDAGGAIRIYGLSNSDIVENTVRGGQRGIEIGPSMADTSADLNVIANNCVHDNQGFGVGAFGSGGRTFDWNTIEGNRVYNNADRGIQMSFSEDTGNSILSNEIYNNASDGLVLSGSSDAEITANSVHNNAFTTQTLSGPSGDPNSGFGGRAIHGGVALLSAGGAATNITIANNEITANGALGAGFPGWGGLTSDGTSNGIFIETGSGAGVVIHDNIIADNGQYNVANENAAPAVNAGFNWWGSSLQEFPMLTTTGGVDFSPWLHTGTDALGDPGFQGQRDILHVSPQCPQTAAMGVIEEGIDAAVTTVFVEAGVYDENLALDRNINLWGRAVSPPNAVLRPTAKPATGSIIEIGDTTDGGAIAPVVDLATIKIDGAQISDLFGPSETYRGVSFRPGSSGQLRNCVLALNTPASFGLANSSAIDVNNATAAITGSTIADYHKQGLTIRNNANVTALDNVFIGTNPLKLGKVFSQNGIWMSDGDVTALIGRNRFQDFGPAGPPQAAEGEAKVNDDSSIGVCIGIDWTVPGPAAIEITTNTLSNAQGVFLDLRAFFAGEFISTGEFLASNTVAGEFMAEGPLDEGISIMGRRCDDPNFPNYQLNNFAFGFYSSDVVYLGAGDYPLTTDMLDPGSSLTLVGLGGTANLLVPDTFGIPTNVTIGADVTTATYSTIADLDAARALPVPSIIYRVSGPVTVISNTNGLDASPQARNQLFVQDASGLDGATGLMIDDPERKFCDDYAIGDSLSDLVGHLTSVSGMLRFTPVIAPTHAGMVAPPAPRDISTVSNFEDVEGELVQLSGVSILLGGKWNADQNYFFLPFSTIISTIRVEDASELVGRTIPTGGFDVRGVAVQNGATRQLQPRIVDDTTPESASRVGDWVLMRE